MRRVLLLALFAACSSTPATPDAPHVDAPAAEDAPTDAAGSGSGSDAVAFQASPRDHGLDVTVLALGFAIVLVPASQTRRRRGSRVDAT